MGNQMPSRICKGDKIRIKKGSATKYGSYPDLVWDVIRVDKTSGRQRLYATRPNSDGPTLLWESDCELAWMRSSTERRKALGL